MVATTSKGILNEAHLKFLKSRNLTGVVRLSNLFVPNILRGFLPKLSAKQRSAFDKVMPVGGQKRLYFQLDGTPTPPIVAQLAQPLVMDVMSEEAVKKAGIKGIKLNVDDLPALLESVSGSGDILGALKSLKGQTGTVLSLIPIFTPLISLGPAEIKDLQKRALAHFKPVIGMLPH